MVLYFGMAPLEVVPAMVQTGSGGVESCESMHKDDDGQEAAKGLALSPQHQISIAILPMLKAIAPQQ